MNTREELKNRMEKHRREIDDFDARWRRESKIIDIFFYTVTFLAVLFITVACAGGAFAIYKIFQALGWL